MPIKEWNEITARYQEEYIHSRYAENARGILNLIPRIKDDPIFADVVPFTSHTALCLEVPDNKFLVVVWCEKGSEEYTISIEKDGIVDEEIKISDSKIVSTLQEYIRKISSG